MITCAHERIAFQSGDYYVACLTCGSRWATMKPGQPEYGADAAGREIGASPATANQWWPHGTEPVRRLVSPAVGAGWRPIASAPKDGTRIQLMLLKSPQFRNLPEILWIKVGSWRADYRDGQREAWREMAIAAVDTAMHPLFPTHWQPLPLPPAPEEAT